MACTVSKAANSSVTEFFPAPDHDWHDNVFDIAEQAIIDLGPGNLKILFFGPPCGDFSKLRLLIAGGGDPRPGLNGKNGKVFRQCITVAKWVLKHNPDCEFFCECVDFRDMRNDWDEVCRALGKPEMVNSEVYSFTKRSRSYWNNVVYLTPRDLPTDWPLTHACWRAGLSSATPRMVNNVSDQSDIPGRVIRISLRQIHSGQCLSTT